MTNEPKRTSVAELAAIDRRGTGLRVRFYLRNGHYIHEIETLDGLLTRTLLKSIDEDEKSSWPPSPSLQHLNISEIVSDTQHGRVAMLVGASGRYHWSMCVAAHQRFTRSGNCSNETELEFDIACRTDSIPDFVGSTYRSMGRPVAISERMNCAFVPADEPGIVVVPKNAEVQVEFKRTLSPVLICKPTEVRFKEFPATLRWHYAIRRSSGGPLHVSPKSVQQAQPPE